MSSEEPVKRLEILIEEVEAYVKQGEWEADKHKKALESVDKAKTIFGEIIDGFIASSDRPPLEEAYNVTKLQERMHEFEHNMPIPPPPEVKEGVSVARTVTVYTAPT